MGWRPSRMSGQPGVGGPQRHACKFADRPACSTLLALECEGRWRPRGCEGAEVATNCIHYSCSRAPRPRSSAPRHRDRAGARAPRCERRRPTIVYEMIMVARYEVAGLREAVRHLDWPVGSYKRREARADDAIMPLRARVDVGSWGRASLFARDAVPRCCRRETV